MTTSHPTRRPHSRHRRRRRNRRSPEGNRGRARAAGVAGTGAAARRATTARANLLGEIDSLDIVNFLSWRYHDPEKQLAARLGITPRHCYYGPVGGESPIRFICTRRRNASRAANAASPRSAAPRRSRPRPRRERAGIDLPWTPFAHDVPEPKRGAAFQKPMAVQLGVVRPITVYPLYEAATSAHWGQTPREAMAESGELWSRYCGASRRTIPTPG